MEEMKHAVIPDGLREYHDEMTKIKNAKTPEEINALAQHYHDMADKDKRHKDAHQFFDELLVKIAQDAGFEDVGLLFLSMPKGYSIQIRRVTVGTDENPAEI